VRLTLFVAGMWLAALTTLALAQDPVQLDVRHFKVEFENVQVRVLLVNIGTHESTPLYWQPPGVLVWLTDAHLKCTGVDGKIEEVRSIAKQVAWSPAMQRTCENVGDQPVELYEILLKARRPFPE
jgi:hypothetical protein